MISARAGEYDQLLEGAKQHNSETIERLQAEKAELEAEKAKQEVEAYLTEAVKEAKYPQALEEAYLSAVKAGKPGSKEEAEALLEEQRKIFDPLAASQTLAGKGFNRVDVTGPVIEQETGYPEFAKVSFAIGQKLEESAQGTVRNFQKPQTAGERLTANMLKLYDQRFGNQLLEEARLYEAETTADLNIPFSMVRAVVAEAYPSVPI